MNKVIVKRNNDSFSEQYNLGDNDSLTLILFNDGSSISNMKVNAVLNNGASLNIYNVVTSNLDSNLDEEITINGSNSKVEIINVLLLGGSAKLESDIMIHHNDKSSESNFENYAIAIDDAKMILNNNATIKAGASKSIVHQKAKGLTLSKNASITAKPNLFIDEYDVIANHAASIGSINKEDLFYLMSRGLTETEAGKLIVMGFISPLLDKIEDVKLKEEINNNFVSML